MNKSELVKAVAQEANLTQSQAKAAIDAAISITTSVLAAGDQLAIPGVATISTGRRAERQGKNPITGEPITIPAKFIVKFKAGKSLTDAIN